MAASQPANFNLQEFTDVGQLMVGGRLYTYAYGTTALKVAYTDPDGAVPHTYTLDGAGGQYIALNARAELPAPLYLGDGSYDLVLKRADGSTVWMRKADGVDNAAKTGIATLTATLAASDGSSKLSFTQIGARAVVRTLQDELRDMEKLEQHGAVGNGVADDTAAILAALASGRTVVARAGSIYKLSDAITVDIGKQGFIGNGSVLDFSALAGTSKTAITLVNGNTAYANDLNVPLANRHFVEGFAILGPGKAGGGASFVDDATKAFSNHTAHTGIANCLFYGFGGGVDVFTEGYIQTYDRLAISQCGTGINVRAGGTNYGERIVFTNSAIYDNKLALSNNCPTGAVQFIGCSLDYNLKTLEASNSSVTELISTWWECNDAGAGNVVATLTGGASLTMSGGRVQQNGTPGALAQNGFLNTSADSVATFRDVFMFNTKNAANVFDAGNGLCELESVKSYAVSYLPGRISTAANNRMADGGFATAAVQDLFSIVEDTAAITNRLTGANVTLSLSSAQAHSGPQSLKFQKVAGGAPGSFVLAIPVKPGSRVAASIWYRKEAAALSSATVFVQTQAVRLLGLKSNGVPDFTSSSVLDTFAIGGTDALIDWTKIETSMDRRMPSWANAFLIYFNATAFQGTFHFDDFNISSM